MGSLRGTSVLCTSHGIQRFKGWHILHGIARGVSLRPTLMAMRKGVVDVSKHVLEGGADIETVGELAAVGIVMTGVVVVHRDGDGKRTRCGQGCL